MMNETHAEHGPEVGRNSVESVMRDGAGRLVVRIAGRPEPVMDARVARCFPWSIPGRHISVMDKDGKEVAFLTSLETVDLASRLVLEDELHDKVFNPRIRKVVKHKVEFGVTSITAETDRGQVIFQIRSRDDIRVLSPTRVLFRDADGNTYEVPDLTILDSYSRGHIEDYV